jgi:hypothetical protein
MKRIAAIILAAAMILLCTASGSATASTAAAQPAAAAAAAPENPTIFKINVTESPVYEAASDKATVMTMAPKDYAFTPSGVTKTYWQITFWLGNDADTLYIGYVKKSDCAVVSL